MAQATNTLMICKTALAVAGALFLLTGALLTGALLSGCASTPPTYSTQDHQPQGGLEKTLYQQYQQWKGVHYRLGGLSKQGVDCSGFVYLTFRNKLGRNMSRTTARQSREGVRIDRHELRTGDLVFFKIEHRKRHVGIYLADGQFLHASSSQGVTISSLDNPYWQQYYWQARRVPV